MKVLDFSRVLAGPFATMILGDLGAEVVKVEPLAGEEGRTFGPALSTGTGGFFMIVNRNKKSITLDLKNPRTQQLAYELAGQANVVIENFKPGVAGRLNIDYDSLSRNHPGLIYCSISGFGQFGPNRDKKAYDPIIQGVTGLLSMTGERDGPPVKVPIPIADLTSGLYAVVAIQAAHAHLLKTGEGQYIDLALYDSLVSLLTNTAMEYFVTGQSPKRWGLDHMHRVPARAFETKDGKYVQVLATSESMYPTFCKLLGLDDLIDDPRFDSNLKRVENRSQIMPIFERKMRDKTRDEWLRLFDEADLPCGSLNDLAEVFTGTQVQERDMLFTMQHPEEGAIPQLGFPYKFSSTPAQGRLPPPRLGEHTEEVLRGWLGYSAEDIGRLREQRVVS
jgi:crotonobetainyl-CoA:carnitine CoA-transferase CaiB-like acyl-CoA transferase